MVNQTQDLEDMAREALNMVARHGVNGSPVDRDALVYGVLNGVFEHKDIVEAQKKYKALGHN